MSKSERNLARKQRRRGRSNRNRRRGSAGKARPRDNSPLGMFRRHFIHCGRCSYFLAGYQAAEGLDHLKGLAELNEDWAALHWNKKTAELVSDSLGKPIDADFDFFSVSCPECARLYEFYAGNDERDQLFRVQVVPILSS